MLNTWFTFNATSQTARERRLAAGFVEVAYCNRASFLFGFVYNFLTRSRVLYVITV